MILYYRSVSLLFHMFNSQRFFPSDMGRVPYTGSTGLGNRLDRHDRIPPRFD